MTPVTCSTRWVNCICFKLFINISSNIGNRNSLIKIDILIFGHFVSFVSLFCIIRYFVWKWPSCTLGRCVPARCPTGYGCAKVGFGHGMWAQCAFPWLNRHGPTISTYFDESIGQFCLPNVRTMEQPNREPISKPRAIICIKFSGGSCSS